MSITSRTITVQRPHGHDAATLDAHLFGVVDFDSMLALQQRLVYEISGRGDCHAVVLLCEHRPLVTVGRQGSRSHLRITDAELAQRGIDLRWVNRGGGCIVHGPGQLAVYPIVPLENFGLQVGAYLAALQSALADTLRDVGVVVRMRGGKYGIWGRTGQLAVVGSAVKHWTTYHGMYVNVAPRPGLSPRIVTGEDPLDSPSSLTAETGRAIRMASVREGMIRNLSESLGCDRHHVYAGHPLMSAATARHQQAASRVG